MKEPLTPGPGEDDFPPDLLTTVEAAALLGVQPSRVRQLVMTGHLRPLKRAGANFYHRADVGALAPLPGRGWPKGRKRGLRPAQQT